MADPRNGCPNCEFTIKYKEFRKELDKELGQLPKGTRQGQQDWPDEYLLELANEVAMVHYSYPKGAKPRWDVVTYTLVSVYRDELTKMKAIDRLNNDTAAPTSNSGADEDEGDFD
jgi:hypothetical protein